MVTGSRKERRAQIACMGRKERERRMRAFLVKAVRDQVNKETL
jgi:hypothetical protein